MSEKRYVVPEGMRLAAGRATNGVDPEGFLIYPALEAALRWQSENLKVPTEKEWAACLQDARRDSGISPVMAWVRRMYLTPEPEAPEAPPLSHGQWRLWKGEKVLVCGEGDVIVRRGEGMVEFARPEELTPLECEDKSEAPEHIEDLLLVDIQEGFFKPEVVNERLHEAFRRGQKAGK